MLQRYLEIGYRFKKKYCTPEGTGDGAYLQEDVGELSGSEAGSFKLSGLGDHARTHGGELTGHLQLLRLLLTLWV